MDMFILDTCVAGPVSTLIVDLRTGWVRTPCGECNACDITAALDLFDLRDYVQRFGAAAQSDPECALRAEWSRVVDRIAELQRAANPEVRRQSAAEWSASLRGHASGPGGECEVLSLLESIPVLRAQLAALEYTGCAERGAWLCAVPKEASCIRS